MQVQIHQRVKILKKDLWVWSVEGRGGGMGNRVIKAFDHMLKSLMHVHIPILTISVKVSIHPPTHAWGFSTIS